MDKQQELSISCTAELCSNMHLDDSVSDLYCYSCFIRDMLMELTKMIFLAKSFTSAESNCICLGRSLNELQTVVWTV